MGTESRGLERKWKKNLFCVPMNSWVSTADIPTRLQLGWSEVRYLVEQDIFLFCKTHGRPARPLSLFSVGKGKDKQTIFHPRTGHDYPE